MWIQGGVQCTLISMLEKWKESLDNGDFAGAVLMDLSKAVDWVRHDLLIAKLNAYAFNRGALKILCSYLSERWQPSKLILNIVPGMN